jgi:hypothetical protein
MAIRRRNWDPPQPPPNPLPIIFTDPQGVPNDAPVVFPTVPAQSDGSPFFAPCIFPTGVYLYATGAGDGTTRGNGTLMTLQLNTVGEASTTWGYQDLMLVAGGGALFAGAEFGDWVSLEIYAPATQITPNASNTGNCNVISEMIIPAQGNGAYDVDLSTANPVPAIQPDGSYNGYWNWDYVWIGNGNITVGNPGSAHFYLLIVDMTLIRFVNKFPLLGNSGKIDLVIPAIEPKPILPHWKSKMTIHNDSGHTGLQVAAYMIKGRAITV